jgi:hypothetical protein
MKEIKKLVITLKLLSRVALTILTFVPYVISCIIHVGTDPIGLESTTSFDEAKFSSSLE